ncbi:hypothetical protein [Kitasatospora phosalacinea]|nr:hypothetical protein [Kitasatospora phosalacinea]
MTIHQLNPPPTPAARQARDHRLRGIESDADTLRRRALQLAGALDVVLAEVRAATDPLVREQMLEELAAELQPLYVGGHYEIDPRHPIASAAIGTEDLADRLRSQDA